VFAGRPTPIDPEAFKIVAALDLLWLAPALAGDGTLLSKQRPWAGHLSVFRIMHLQAAGRR
jgi:hypothetical protein